MKKEKWQEIYKKEELIAIQNIEKKIFMEFIRICKELKIEYFVYGGTLLGTIKYKNIIPWDDDIDVALTRENYNIFLSEANKKISEDFIIQTPYNDSKTPYSYTKLRMKGTKYIEEFHHKLDIEKGIYIDIYPVDNIPDDEILRKKQWKKAQFYCKLYYLRQCKHINIKKDNFIRILRHSIIYYVLRILPQKYYYKKIDKYMTMYNSIETKRKACLFSPNYENIYTKLYPLMKKKFGTIEVLVPFCYNEHLTNRYGNYKKDLPEDKRIGHIPYEFYIPEKYLKEDEICK